MHEHPSRLLLPSTVAIQVIYEPFLLLYLVLAYLCNLTLLASDLCYLMSAMPWTKAISFLNAIGLSGIVARLAQRFPYKKGHLGCQISGYLPMRGLTRSSYCLNRIFVQWLANTGMKSSRSAITEPGADEPRISNQYSDAPEVSGSQQIGWTELNIVSTRSGNRTLTQSKILQAFLRVASTYLAVSWIPLALAQEDCYRTQMSTGSNWHNGLVLASVAVVSGHVIKKYPSHAWLLSLWYFCVVGVSWHQLDFLAQSVAVVVGISPLLTVGVDQIWKRLHERRFDGKREEVYRQQKMDIKMEEGDLKTRSNEDEALFDWTEEPRQEHESTGIPRDSIQEDPRFDQCEDRDGSPEPWNGTEGFKRHRGSKG